MLAGWSKFGSGLEVIRWFWCEGQTLVPLWQSLVGSGLKVCSVSDLTVKILFHIWTPFLLSISKSCMALDLKGIFQLGASWETSLFNSSPEVIPLSLCVMPCLKAAFWLAGQCVGHVWGALFGLPPVWVCVCSVVQFPPLCLLRDSLCKRMFDCVVPFQAMGIIVSFEGHCLVLVWLRYGLRHVWFGSARLFFRLALDFLYL